MLRMLFFLLNKDRNRETANQIWIFVSYTWHTLLNIPKATKRTDITTATE